MMQMRSAVEELGHNSFPKIMRRMFVGTPEMVDSKKSILTKLQDD